MDKIALHPSVTLKFKWKGPYWNSFNGIQLEHIHMMRAGEIYIHIVNETTLYAVITPGKPSQVTRRDRIVAALQRAYDRAEVMANQPSTDEYNQKLLDAYEARNAEPPRFLKTWRLHRYLGNDAARRVALHEQFLLKDPGYARAFARRVALHKMRKGY